MNDDKYRERKKKIDILLLKNEIETTTKLLKPYHKEEILRDFDLNDDFLFDTSDNLDTEIKYFLNRKINYSTETESIVILLEKSAYVDIFLSNTVGLIKNLCEKINSDLKHSELENIK